MSFLPASNRASLRCLAAILSMLLPTSIALAAEPDAAAVASDAAPPDAALPSMAAEELFELRIRPVLAATCAECHRGSDASGGLRVDTGEHLLSGGDSGPAIVPGDPKASLLFQAISRTHATLKMPPDEPLSADVIAAFAQWINAGAAWPAKQGSPSEQNPAQPATVDRTELLKHWAFQPITQPALPPLQPGDSEHPIDRFIVAKLRAAELRQVPQASRATLMRRLAFDLTGMPPADDEELAKIDEGASPATYPELVERFLASPRFGERWARHWMDVVHYADTAGDNADYPVPEARLYRDYLIDSFNADLPFDQLLREQIAGDVLAKQEPSERSQQQIIATTYLGLTRRYATAPFELWHLSLEDAIDTLGRGMLGLTVRCARCHDHKFDPLTSEDYYALYGIFSSTQFPYAGSEEFQSKKFPRQFFVPLTGGDDLAAKTAAHTERMKTLEAEIAAAEKDDPLTAEIASLTQQIEQLTAPANSQAGNQAVNQPGTPAINTAQQRQQALDLLNKAKQRTESDLRKKLKPLREELAVRTRNGGPPEVPLAYAVAEGTIADAPLQRRGEPGDARAAVPRGVPKFLSGAESFTIAAGSSGRLELARWLTSRQNPLTARVIVNRVWQHLMGRGIVGSPSNFGVRGEAPTHPELLDWLTSDFLDHGWSIKHLVRRIVSSNTYQLASSSDPAAEATDPANRLGWRHSRRRLEAEELRDAILWASGQLDESRPQNHPFPPIQQWGWTQHNAFKELYPSNHRSVYLMTQRLQRHPYLALFDGPDPNTSTEMRTSSTVPLQALYLLNSPWVREQANDLGEKLTHYFCINSGEPFCASWDRKFTNQERARVGWWRIASVPDSDPTFDALIESTVEYIARYEQELADAGVAEADRPREAWASWVRLMFCSNQFIYLD